MSDTNNRRFSVHGRHEDRQHARVVLEPSFEAAAAAYLEQVHVEGQDEVSVVVRDLETGHEHCFRMDVDTGAAAPCS